MERIKLLKIQRKASAYRGRVRNCRKAVFSPVDMSNRGHFLRG